MLGENTIFYTRKGFKKLKNLNKYDEVLNSDGRFTYITRLGPWVPMDKCVTLTTGENICCSNNLLWDLNKTGKFLYTDELELEEDAVSYVKSVQLPKVKWRSLKNSYEKSVVVPKEVSYKYVTADLDTKLACLAGLIDSPICELGDSDGIYVFYTHLSDIAFGIVALARSLKFGVLCRRVAGLYIVRVHICQYDDKIPIKDPYKACYGTVNIFYAVRMMDIRNIEPSEGILGRSIELKDGACLIGYSLVSVI